MKGSAKALVGRLGSAFVVIALLAPVLALSMIAGGRFGALSEGSGNEWLLIALAFGGAAASALNGLGRSVRRSHAVRTPQGSHQQAGSETIQVTLVSSSSTGGMTAH